MVSNPDTGAAEVWNQRGRQLYEQGDWAAALAAYRQCAAMAGPHPAIVMNIAKCHFQLGAMDDCITLLENTAETAITHGYVNLFYDLASAFHLKKDYESAALNYRKYCEYKNFTDPAALTRAMATSYIAGRLDEFWAFFENRRRLPWHVENYPNIPNWPGLAGGIVPAGRLLVHGEQGFGDQIQFGRFINRLIGTGIQPTIAVGKPLVRLFKAAFPHVRIIALSDPPDGHFDYKCALVSLPYLLNLNSMDDIRHARLPLPPPLTAGAAPARGRPRVGLVWKGNPNHANDQRRSLPASQLRPLLDLGDVDFVSLNPALAAGVARSGLANLRQAIHPGDDFLRSAEIIATLDLVISIDSAPAHLAGTLGVPVWTLLPFEPDWRWGLLGDTTPWYPRMKLYRQPREGDWASVIDRVATDLKAGQYVPP